MRGLNVHITADGQLGFEVDWLAEYLRAGAITGPSGAHAAEAAKIQLHPAIRPLEQPLVLLADVPRFKAAVFEEDERHADERSRYQRYMDSRKAKRLAKAQELARIEAENLKREQEAIHRGMHEEFLRQRAKAEDRARYAPETVDKDLDFSQWSEQGEPEDVAVTVPARDSLAADEGEIIRD